MLADTKREEYKYFDKAALAVKGGKAYRMFAERAREKDWSDAMINHVTLSMYILFTAADGSTDIKEYTLYKLISGNDDITLEYYRNFAKASYTPEGVRDIFMSCIDVMKKMPETRNYLETLALCAIVANGEVNDGEKKLFETFFGD